MTRKQKLAFFKKELEKTKLALDEVAAECLEGGQKRKHYLERRLETGIGMLAGHTAMLADCLLTMMKK